MGTSLVWSSRLMFAAVSKPSIPGMRMSSRTTANRRRSSAFIASSPDRARISGSLRDPRTASSAIRLSSMSSTRRMLARSSVVSSALMVTVPHSVSGGTAGSPDVTGPGSVGSAKSSRSSASAPSGSRSAQTTVSN
ncbi:hypothetical protein Save01_06854 [Streptomyces avermitilis]